MIEKLGKFIIKNYIWVLIVSLFITILSIYGISKLKMETQMTDMLPGEAKEVKLFEYAMDNFTGMESVIVAVEGDKKDIISFINEVAPKIEEVPGIYDVLYKTDTEFIEKNNLILAGDPDELRKISGMLTASSLQGFVKGLNDNLEQTYTDSGDSKKLSKDKSQVLRFLTTIQNFVKTFGGSKATIPASDLVELSSEFVRGPKYMISHDESMGILMAKTSIDIADMGQISVVTDGIEDILADSAAKYNVRAQIAGNVALQRDEMRYTTADMNLTSIVSLVLILIIFYIGFRVIRYSLLAVVPLIIGIIWGLGFTSFTIGSLNIMTTMMVAILIGLGIDYAIHVIALFTEGRNKGMDVDSSLQMVFDKAMRGVITGSVTTALGFFVFTLSSFEAFREFGFVLGCGILTTLLASIFVLPALLKIFHFKIKKVEVRDKFGDQLFRFENFLSKRAFFVVVITFLVAVICAVAIPRVSFTRNWLDIEPKGMPSVEIEKIIIDKFDFSSSSSLFINKTLDESDRLKEKAEDLSTVGFIDSISQYVPEKREQLARMKVAARIKSLAARRPDNDIDIPGLRKQMTRLKNNIIELSDLAYIGGEKKLVRKCDAIIKSKIFTVADDMIGKNTAWIRHFQKVFIRNLADKVRNTNSSKVITLADVPKDIRESYIGKDGAYLTQVYPTDDPWQVDFQEIHLAQLKTINNTGTGMVQMIIQIMEISGREGRRVMMLTVLFIYIILLIDLRSFKFATFAMLPMGLTLTIVLGIMGWFGLKFNFVNVLALPMIIGIGVDDGVHLIHRYLLEKNLSPAIRSTGRAITLTTLTTAAAFGSMLLAKYRGFSSF
ncbi:MAG: MMPL family transporter, partial [Candidatus Saganbacteria bacterium]|nr:MMPL family transporter [Candidatus Saganbacteria bacterium]